MTLQAGMIYPVHEFNRLVSRGDKTGFKTVEGFNTQDDTLLSGVVRNILEDINQDLHVVFAFFRGLLPGSTDGRIKRTNEVRAAHYCQSIDTGLQIGNAVFPHFWIRIDQVSVGAHGCAEADRIDPGFLEDFFAFVEIQHFGIIDRYLDVVKAHLRYQRRQFF